MSLRIDRFPFPDTVRIPHGAQFIGIDNDSGQDFAYYAVDPDMSKAHKVTFAHRPTGSVIDFEDSIRVEFLGISTVRIAGQPQVLVAIYIPEEEPQPT